MSSTAELLQNIAGNFGDIVRSEVQLAKAEIREEVRKAARGGAMLGAGAVMALFGASFFLWTLAFALTSAMPVWAAALIVSILLFASGGFMLATGLSQMRRVHAKPEKTMECVREDVQWIKQRT
jgi:hypothetical protein